MSKIVNLGIIDKSKVKNKVIFSTQDVNPLIKGMELENYNCGNCGFLLAENVIPNSIKNIIIECPKCKSYNDIPPQGI